MAGALTVDIEKRFARGAVVAPRFDAALRAGAILVVFGPSGAGKTTLVRCLAGLERPEAGRIVCDGETWLDAHTWVPPQQRRIGYVGQEAALFPHLSVRANVGYGLGARSDRPRDRRIDELLALAGVSELQHRRPHELWRRRRGCCSSTSRSARSTGRRARGFAAICDRSSAGWRRRPCW